jgi:radical SAM superfamily enzyme YgiQ (UPF0313 family)
MILRFIYPRFRKFLESHEELDSFLSKYLVGNYTMPPSLAIPILAALTPDEHEVRLTDDNYGDPINYDEKIDAVVISCFTPQAQRAYEIADEYRMRGTTVLMGGIHPTALPEEAKLHADAVCIGEGEPVWPQMLADLKAKTLKPFYKATSVYSLSQFPNPERNIFRQDIYKWNAHLVLTTRGCPVMCDGCPIPDKEGTQVRLRPIENIVEDIRTMPYKQFYFTDDTIMLPGKKYSKFMLNLMERTKELDVSIFVASTMMMLPDPQFYKKLAKGGVSSMYTVFGFDRVSQQLFDPSCTKEQWQAGIDLVKMNEDAGIHFFASIGIGFDNQNRSVVDRILKFCSDANIDLAEFYIPTPFPGTPLGRRAEAEGRILHRNYNIWNHGNIVFKPLNFTETELMDDFYTLWKCFYSGIEPSSTLRTFDISKTIL